MPERVAHQRILRFDKFEVDLQTGSLSKRGAKVMLREQAFAVLASLLERPGELVTREELRRRLWPDNVFVDFENLLNTAVARLRLALGDSAEHPHFIETLHKRGYRFIGSLTQAEAARQTSPWKVKLVVLPFENLSGDPGLDYVCNPISDELITALAGLTSGRLGVIARTTAMRYKGSHKSVACIGRELGVDYVVEGGLHRSQGPLAINVQVIQVKDQMHLFARKYEAELCDVLKVMNGAASDISGSIGLAAALGVNQTGLVDSGKAHKPPTGDLEAYDECTHARFIMTSVTPAAFAKARSLLESAIARDAECAPAYDALAEMYWYLAYWGMTPPRKAISLGIAQALRAVEIDNTRAETHALLGEFHKIIEYNWPEVDREMTLARQLDPVSPLVRLRYARSWLMPHGLIKEAVAEVKNALQLDPLSMMGWGWLSILLSLQYQQEGSIDAAEASISASQRAHELNPGAWGAYIGMGATYRQQGNFKQAITAYREGVKLSESLPNMIGNLGMTLGLSGKAAEARSLLKRLHACTAQRYVSPTSFAWIYLGLGDIDAAFEWLDRAVDECDQYLMPIKTYGFFDPIRADPRFLVLLRKMKLEP